MRLKGLFDYVSTNIDFRALRFLPGGVSWLPGYLAGTTVVAYTADVGDECDLGDIVGGFNRNSGRALQHGQHDPWFHRRVLFNH